MALQIALARIEIKRLQAVEGVYLRRLEGLANAANILCLEPEIIVHDARVALTELLKISAALQLKIDELAKLDVKEIGDSAPFYSPIGF